MRFFRLRTSLWRTPSVLARERTFFRLQFPSSSTTPLIGPAGWKQCCERMSEMSKRAEGRSPRKGQVQAVVGLLDGQEHRSFVNVSGGVRVSAEG